MGKMNESFRQREDMTLREKSIKRAESEAGTDTQSGSTPRSATQHHVYRAEQEAAKRQKSRRYGDSNGIRNDEIARDHLTKLKELLR